MVSDHGLRPIGRQESIESDPIDPEREAFPIDPPSPVDAIRFRMEQMGYSQSDLARLLNSRSRASELLTGSTRRLSLNTIRRLHNEWRIPADALLRDAA